MEDILQELFARIAGYGDQFSVHDLRIGIRYSAVSIIPSSPGTQRPIKSVSCGLAATPHRLLNSDQNSFKPPLFSLNEKAGETLLLLDRKNLLHRTVGLAICNAVINAAFKQKSIPDLSYSPYKNRSVAMVGYFEPIVRSIMSEARSLGILEIEKTRQAYITQSGLKLLSIQDLASYETVIVTATTLINRTFEEIVNCCPDSHVILMGPSSPLMPEIFMASYPQIRNISGRLVKDIPRTMEVISRGGGTPHFKFYTEKITILLEPSGNEK